MRKLLYGLVLLCCLPACMSGADGSAQQQDSAVSKSGGKLTPYYTPTVTDTAVPLPENTFTPSPQPTSTPEPETHEVVAGEDLLTIAIRYGVTLEALKAANPEVDSHLISIGTVLVIPGDEQQVVPAAEVSIDATPAPISAGEVRCAPALDGSLWCFVLVQNPLQEMVTGVSVRVTLQDEKGDVLEQVGAALLNGLQPGYSIPLQVYFQADEGQALSSSMQAGAELVSAVPVAEGAGCCLPLRIDNNRFEVLEDGLSAQVRGELVFEGVQDSSASQAWVLAVAYNRQGRVCGLRRWESSEVLPAGQPLAYEFRVYSVAEPIDHVEVMAEAHY